MFIIRTMIEIILKEIVVGTLTDGRMTGLEGLKEEIEDLHRIRQLLVQPINFLQILKKQRD